MIADDIYCNVVGVGNFRYYGIDNGFGWYSAQLRMHGSL